MIYINPIEILELKDTEVQDIDTKVIKKAKRRLFAEIDLSENGHLVYHGQSLTRSDCERVIEELEDIEKVKFYSHLASNLELNTFLATGEGDLLKNLRPNSIYNSSEFKNFLSPFFALQIDLVLVRSFQNNNFDIFSLALTTDYLISESDITRSYKSLSNEIQHRINETDKITKNINSYPSSHPDEDIASLTEKIRNNFPPEYLNILPAFFQSQINKIGASINLLQLSIWNELNITQVPVNLLEHLLKLNIESVSKPIFEKNYTLIKAKHDSRIEQERNAPLLKEWAKVINSIKEKIEEVENESLMPKEALLFVKTSLNLKALNALPNFANEIRTQIGYSIRSLSIASWNKHSDILIAQEFINLALKIKVDKNEKEKFIQDKTELQEIRKKHEGVIICHFCGTNPPDKGSEIKKTIYKETSRSFYPSNSIYYNYADVRIPRCKSCQETHSKAENKLTISFLTLSLLGVVIGAFTEGSHYFIGGIIGAVFGSIFGRIITIIHLNKSSTKSASERKLKRHPVLIERMKDGWTFSKPTA